MASLPPEPPLADQIPDELDAAAPDYLEDEDGEALTDDFGNRLEL